MLHELDTALRALVELELGDDADVEVEFDAPTKDWASHRNRPTIDIYLYDIRQDLTRSQFGQIAVRASDGSLTQRRPQPKFFRLAYLVTAWTQRAEDEHRLLSSLMVTFLRHETVPMDLLQGSLADLGISIPLAVALPPPQDRALSDVWSALGGELKPSLDVSVIAPLLPERFHDAGPPVTLEPMLNVVDRRTMAREASGARPMPPDRVRGDRLRAPSAAADPSRRRPDTEDSGERHVRAERSVGSRTCSVGSTCCASVLPRSSTARTRRGHVARRSVPRSCTSARNESTSCSTADRPGRRPTSPSVRQSGSGGCLPTPPRDRQRDSAPRARRTLRARRSRCRPAAGGDGTRRRRPLRALLRVPQRRCDEATGQHRAGARARRRLAIERVRPRPLRAVRHGSSAAVCSTWKTSTDRSSPEVCGYPIE